MKSYEEIFENQFNPHLEIMHFIYPVEEKETEIQPEFVEKSQIQDEKPVEKPTESKIEITALEPVFPIKNITPKKHFWRK